MGSRHRSTSSAPPVLASIGTVLIDVFDMPQTPPINPTESHFKPLNWVHSTASTPGSSSSTSNAHTSTSNHLSPTSTAPSQRSVTPQKTIELSAVVEENTYEVFGGGALYALVGARMWLGSDKVRTMVDRQTTSGDIAGVRETEKEREPRMEYERLLRRYGDITIISDSKGKAADKGTGEEETYGMWVFNEGPEKRLARARIRYEGDVRLYQHTVKTPHRTYSVLCSSPLRNAEYLHIAPPFSSEDLHRLLTEINGAHAMLQEGEERWYPKIIFEPTPPSCHAGQREWLEKVYAGIEVFSPNHEELLCLYSDHPVLTSLVADPSKDEDTVMKTRVEALIAHVLGLGIGRTGDGAVVIRCGRLGSVVGTKKGGTRWFPAFYGAEEAGRVKDVTGAGNSYLGGYAAGLHLSGGDAYKAALYGTVSASFTVEQVGLPPLSTDAHGEESWNGERPIRRLEKFEASLPGRS